MIIAQGGLVGGWAFYVESGRPVFHYHVAGVERYTIAAERPLAPGQHTLAFAFNYDGSSAGGGGTGTIFANGKPIAQGRIERTIPRPVSFDEGFDIGEDTGTPVNPDFQVPFRFTGEITEVTVRVREPRTRRGPVPIARKESALPAVENFAAFSSLPGRR